jgi:hypothetical protein
LEKGSETETAETLTMDSGPETDEKSEEFMLDLEAGLPSEIPANHSPLSDDDNGSVASQGSELTMDYCNVNKFYSSRSVDGFPANSSWKCFVSNFLKYMFILGVFGFVVLCRYI